jgi:hypothetical protein
MAGLVPAIDVLPAVIGHAFDRPSAKQENAQNARHRSQMPTQATPEWQVDVYDLREQ